MSLHLGKPLLKKKKKKSVFGLKQAINGITWGKEMGDLNTCLKGDAEKVEGSGLGPCGSDVRLCCSSGRKENLAFVAV